MNEIIQNGGKASYHKFDIMDEATIKALIEDTARDFGHVDILVNNAASVDAQDGNVADLTAEQWDYMLASDLKSVFLVSKYAILQMQKQHKGSIINIGSTAGIAGNLGWSAYGPAKAGVVNLTKNIAYQYGKDNIRCNCIQPGLIVTPPERRERARFLPPDLPGSILTAAGLPSDAAHRRRESPRRVFPPSAFMKYLSAASVSCEIDAAFACYPPPRKRGLPRLLACASLLRFLSEVLSSRHTQFYENLAKKVDKRFGMRYTG